MRLIPRDTLIVTWEIGDNEATSTVRRPGDTSEEGGFKGKVTVPADLGKLDNAAITAVGNERLNLDLDEIYRMGVFKDTPPVSDDEFLIFARTYLRDWTS